MIKPVFLHVNLSENIQQQVVNLKDPHFPASTLSPPVIDFDKEDSLLKENVIFILDALVYSRSSTIQIFFLNGSSFWQWRAKTMDPPMLSTIYLHYDEYNTFSVGFCLCSILRFWLIFFGTYGYLRDVKFALFFNPVFYEHVIPVPYTDANHLAIFI